MLYFFGCLLDPLSITRTSSHATLFFRSPFSLQTLVERSERLAGCWAVRARANPLSLGVWHFTLRFVLRGAGLATPVDLERRAVAYWTQSLPKDPILLVRLRRDSIKTSHNQKIVCACVHAFVRILASLWKVNIYMFINFEYTRPLPHVNPHAARAWQTGTGRPGCGSRRPTGLSPNTILLPDSVLVSPR
jgi:hypothetical protein